MIGAYGTQPPGWLDRKVIAATTRLPNNWLGLRIAIGLRRIVTRRLADDAGLDVVRWGLRMRLHPRYNGCEKAALFTPQIYDALERRELCAEIEKAKSVGRAFVFVDIGANVGLYSLFVASRAGATAKILAIEPEPENLSRLRFNIAANAGVPVRVLPLALGEATGKVVLEPNYRDRGGTRIRPLASIDPASLPVVECRPLLSVLIQEDVSYIDALKIDVEGKEDTILIPFFRDADASLWPRFIIIEDTRNLWRDDLFLVLANQGYTPVARSGVNVMMRRPVR